MSLKVSLARDDDSISSFFFFLYFIGGVIQIDQSNFSRTMYRNLHKIHYVSTHQVPLECHFES